MHNNSRGKKLEVEEHRRNVKLPKNKTSVTACNDSLNAKTLNVKSVSAMCDKCVLIDKHDMCILKYVAKPLKETVASESNKKPRNNTLNVKSISAMCDKCVLIDKHDMRVLKSVAKPLKQTIASESNKKPRNNVRKLYERLRKIYKWSYIKFTPSGYMWKPKLPTGNVNPNLVEIILFIVDSEYSKHITGNLKLLINFVEKFLGTVKFGNDQIAPILGYGDLVQGAITIKRRSTVSNTPLSSNSFAARRDCPIHRRLWMLKAHDGKSQASN
nr:hypothetical protein [Tanacetum cinerariifolium]